MTLAKKTPSLTLIGFVVACLVSAFGMHLETDLFEYIIDRFKQFHAFLHSYEHYELDELIIPAAILLGFGILDLFVKYRNYKLQHEKALIYKAMLFSTHHILNNFLNQMQLFKITAADTEGFDPEIITLYDTIIAQAKEQIESISHITDLREESIYAAIKPK